MSDWEDMLDNDEEIEVKKEGEDFAVEEIVEEPKKTEKQPGKPHKETVNSKTQQPTGKKTKKAQNKNKEVDDKPGQELTIQEKEELERKMKLEAQKDIANMFGSDIGKSLLDFELEEEDHFVKFAKVIYTKVKQAKSKKFLITFTNTLLQEMNDKLTSEDVEEIEKKCTVLRNAKINQEKGKGKKKNKKGATLKVVNKGKEDGGLYDLYDDTNADYNEEDYDYRGKYDDYDFM